MIEKIAEPKHYIAGGLVSNGIVWTIFFILLLMKQNIDLILVKSIHSLSTALSSILAGYLVAGHTSENHIKVGFTTGLVSIVMYYVITFFLIRSFETSAWVLMGFSVGGTLGGAYKKIIINKSKK
jgi:putative membrane protein (TIGR04086 family)